MEETGTYHLTVFSYLIDKGCLVISENELKIKKYLDRELRKTKTDKKEVYKLAFNTISVRFNNKNSQFSAISCEYALILQIKTSKEIILNMNKFTRKLPEYNKISEIP